MSDSLITNKAKEKLRQLCDARDKYAEADKAAKAAKRELDEIELEVFEMFNESGDTGTIPVNLGPPYGIVKFKTRETHFAQIVDEEKLLEWYENRQMVDEVSSPKFVKARLNEEVREAVDASQPLPPGLTYYTNRGMTITRPK